MYDLPGYESFNEDTLFFFDYKESDLLSLSIDDKKKKKKIEFQYNYSVLYWNYLIKCYKSRKVLVHNILIENVLFDDQEFFYKTTNHFVDKVVKNFLIF